MAEEPSASHSVGNEPWDAQRLTRALAERDYSQYDTTLLCAGRHTLYADGGVLAATSPFFRDALRAASKLGSGSRSVLLLPQTQAKLLSPLLQALYCQPASVPRDQREALRQLAADLELPPGITISISDEDTVLESSNTRDVTHQGATLAENHTLTHGAEDCGIQAGSSGFQANSGSLSVPEVVSQNNTASVNLSTEREQYVETNCQNMQGASIPAADIQGVGCEFPPEDQSFDNSSSNVDNFTLEYNDTSPSPLSQQGEKDTEVPQNNQDINPKNVQGIASKNVNHADLNRDKSVTGQVTGRAETVLPSTSQDPVRFANSEISISLISRHHSSESASHTATSSSAVERNIEYRSSLAVQNKKKSSVTQPKSTSTPAETPTFSNLLPKDVTSQPEFQGSKNSQVRKVQVPGESVRQAEKRPMVPSSSTAGSGKAITSGMKSYKISQPGTSREDCATVSEPAGQEADANYRGNHSEQKSHPCDICDKPFSTRSNMLKHIRDVHDKKQPHKCNFCTYRCSEKGKLLKHILAKHSNTKQKVQSGISFSSAKQFSAFSKSNASRQSQGLFKCNNCEYRCVKKAAMKTHMTRNHESTDGCSYACGDCTATFNSQKGLACHKTRAHESKVPPVLLSETCIEENFLNRGHANELSLGNLSNNFSFNFCGPKVGGQSWRCAVCDYSTNQRFNLKRHMLTHTGKKQ